MAKKTISINNLDPNVKFLHLRYKDPAGNVVATGGTTVAYRADDGTVTYALARCHYRDNYRKDLGRIKANGRLLSKRAKTFAGTEAEFQDLIATQIDDDNRRVQTVAAMQGYDPASALLMFRKFNGKRNKVLTDADAAADLAGTPRPDNPSA